MPQVPSSDMGRLTRWEAAGGSWRLVSARAGTVEIALLSCDDHEVMDVLVSGEADVIDYVTEPIA